MLFQVEPQHYSDDFFTEYDIIHVSGGDDEGDFENAHLVQRDVNMAAKIKFYSHFS